MKRLLPIYLLVLMPLYGGTNNPGAPLDSPAFTGVPTAPTATLGTNTTQLATTAFVLANGGSLTIGTNAIGMGFTYSAGTLDNTYATNTANGLMTLSGAGGIQADITTDGSGNVGNVASITDQGSGLTITGSGITLAGGGFGSINLDVASDGSGNLTAANYVTSTGLISCTDGGDGYIDLGGGGGNGGPSGHIILNSATGPAGSIDLTQYGGSINLVGSFAGAGGAGSINASADQTTGNNAGSISLNGGPDGVGGSVDTHDGGAGLTTSGYSPVDSTWIMAFDSVSGSMVPTATAGLFALPSIVSPDWSVVGGKGYDNPTGNPDETLYLTSVTTITSQAVIRPTTTRKGQILRLVSKSAVTTLTISGGATVSGSNPTTLLAGGSIAWQAIDTTGDYIRLY